MKSLLWDLDGTILDPAGGIRDAMDHTLVSLGLPTRGDGELFTGMPLRDILLSKGAKPQQLAQGLIVFREWFLLHGIKRAKFYRGCQEYLNELHADGIRMSIVTTKSQLEATETAKIHGFSQYFEHIIGDDDLNPVKPHPYPILHTLNLMEELPENCYFIGDTEFDAEAAKRAGMPFLWLTHGHGNRGQIEEIGFEAEFDTIADLREYLATRLA